MLKLEAANYQPNISTSEPNKRSEIDGDPVDVLSLQETYRALTKIGSAQVNAYGRDGQEDEYSIRTQNGKVRGFFKTFAPPLAPYLMLNRLTVYEQLHQPIAEWIRSHPEGTYEEALSALASQEQNALLKKNAEKGLQIHQQWTEQCLLKPAWLKANTADMIARAVETDHCLQTVLKEDTLEPEASPSDQVIHTAAQLNLVFSLMSPLYTAEALLDNKREDFPFDPIKQAQQELKSRQIQLKGNKMEALFESATHIMGHTFRESGLDTKYMNWEKLKKMTDQILHNSENKEAARILSELTWKLGSNPVDIMFALWKRSAQSSSSLVVPKSQAQDVFDQSLALTPPTERNEALVNDAQHLNAMFRFMGNVPTHRSEINFTTGEDLVYGSICDTVSKLDRLVAEFPDIWSDSFKETFINTYKPQLEQIHPSSSSKGRILLELLLHTPHAVRPEYKVILDQKIQDTARIETYIDKLSTLREARQIRPVGAGLASPKLIGGKAQGQEYAAHFLTNNNTGKPLDVEISVPTGIEITTERVESLIKRANPDLYRMIVALDQSYEQLQREELAEKIYQGILHLELSAQDIDSLTASASGLNNRIIVRSSAADEATGDKNVREHAGFYESHETDKKDYIPTILRVAASYYNPGSVSFRNDRGLGHLPKMALLIQNYIPQSVGGNLLIEQVDSGTKATIKAADEAAEITSGHNHFTNASQESDNVYRVKHGNTRTPIGLIESLDALQAHLFELQKRPGIIEWGAQLDKDMRPKKVIILQQQMYPPKNENIAVETAPYPDQEPIECRFPNEEGIKASAAQIKALSAFIHSHNGPVTVIFPDNPEFLDLGSEFRALCIDAKDKIQQIKIHSEPPSETSHLGCFILSRFPWLKWQDIWE